MTYNHQMFMSNLRKHGAGPKVIDLGNDAVATVRQEWDETFDTDYLGKWSEVTDVAMFVDRKSRKLYGKLAAFTKVYTDTTPFLANDETDKYDDSKIVAQARLDFPQFDTYHSTVERALTDSGIVVNISGRPVLASLLWVRNFSDRSYRYWIPNSDGFSDEQPQEVVIREVVEAHEHHERYEEGEWCGIVVTVVIYYKGFELSRESCGGFESEDTEGIEQWIKEETIVDLANLRFLKAQELQKQIEALGYQAKLLLVS